MFRPALIAIPALAIASGVISAPSPADAREYPWCAQYSERTIGASNCGFVTLQQCQATISGVGGWCERNLRYAGRQARARHHDGRRYYRD